MANGAKHDCAVVFRSSCGCFVSKRLRTPCLIHDLGEAEILESNVLYHSFLNPNGPQSDWGTPSVADDCRAVGSQQELLELLQFAFSGDALAKLETLERKGARNTTGAPKGLCSITRAPR